MIIKPFTIDVIKNYKLFFMLQKLKSNSGDIQLFHKEVGLDVLFEEYGIFEMNNGYLLIAFSDENKHQTKHNLFATNGAVSEIINLQSYERIYPYYNLGVESEDHGGFTFMNSAPVPSFENQWRCDAGLYGVEFFADPNGGSPIIIPDQADELLVYEPIFSINGDAHIIYTERKNKTNKFNLMNNSITPFATYSLGESFKLILEWASVSQEPFSNVEPISIKASSFVNRLGITQSLVSNQPNMQIFEYLNGNTTARIRPENVSLLSDECNVFIKKNISHMTLSNLVSLYPDCWDINEIIFEELADFENLVYRSFKIFIKDDIDITIQNKENVVELARQTHQNEGLCQFINSKFKLLELKKTILDNLAN
jgi:hypothetical protein